ncbi:hypothetical protein C2G38_2168232 [Gigaspora rosea]|uniref:Serine-threonine/tyrosine-protein kinase catalytic domain-containing protein n=1 Tax=Gigaspora rosea TaxID=44941 RepID=A0A397VPY7_9GLOM|nr:hypothetical protein C2G38_2168232 [Gigaspora rosea]
MSKSKYDGIFGILPYISPEVLINQRYIKASDIYSFVGNFIWKSCIVQSKLAMQQLCLLMYYRDLRSAVNNEAPQCYVNLMRKCWDKNSEKRLSSKRSLICSNAGASSSTRMKSLKRIKLSIPDDS